MNDAITLETTLTVGLALGDRYILVCVLDEAGVDRGGIPPAHHAGSPPGRFSLSEPLRMVLEAGTHSPWVSRLLAYLGHDVLVANPRKLRLIYHNDSKSDRVDAEYLARVGRLDPSLLAPLHHRSSETQEDLALLRSRNCPGAGPHPPHQPCPRALKSLGGRLPSCRRRRLSPRRPNPSFPRSSVRALLSGPCHHRRAHRDEIKRTR